MDALLIVGSLLRLLAAVIWLGIHTFDTSLLWGWGCLFPLVMLMVGLAQLGVNDPE